MCQRSAQPFSCRNQSDLFRSAVQHGDGCRRRFSIRQTRSPKQARGFWCLFLKKARPICAAHLAHATRDHFPHPSPHAARLMRRTPRPHSFPRPSPPQHIRHAPLASHQTIRSIAVQVSAPTISPQPSVRSPSHAPHPPTKPSSHKHPVNRPIGLRVCRMESRRRAHKTAHACRKYRYDPAHPCKRRLWRFQKPLSARAGAVLSARASARARAGAGRTVRCDAAAHARRGACRTRRRRRAVPPDRGRGLLLRGHGGNPRARRARGRRRSAAAVSVRTRQRPAVCAAVWL